MNKVNKLTKILTFAINCLIGEKIIKNNNFNFTITAIFVYHPIWETITIKLKTQKDLVSYKLR